MDYERIVFAIIAHAGNARSLCFDALKLAKEGLFDRAYQNIAQAKEELLQAHNTQSDLLHKEAAGEKHDFGLLMVHAQDHLMCAMLAKDLVEEFMELYRAMNDKSRNS